MNWHWHFQKIKTAGLSIVDFPDKNQNLVYYQEGLFTPEKMKQKLLEISALVGWEMLRRNFSCM
jgi:hypothetical protein